MIPKFRAWHKPSKLMLNVVVINFSLMQVTADIENRKIYPETDYWWKETDIPFSEIELMQSTGLKDKNGVEIFEGDIVHWKDLESVAEVPFDNFVKVEYSDEFMRWVGVERCGSSKDLYDYSDNRELEVIGNIYESKRLLNADNIG